MNWIDHSTLTVASGRCRRAGLIMMVVLLSACAATGPEPGESDQAGEQEAIGETLRADFADAVALKKTGELPEAEARFLALNEAHPDLAGPLANLGIIAMERNDVARAEEYFLQVIALQPEHAHALNHLGVIAREQGSFEQAERYYRQALAGNPDFQPALKNLAILLELYQGRLDEALALVEQYQALQDEPDPMLEGWIFDLKNRMN